MPDRPNVIYIFSDDQRHEYLGCAGHPVLWKYIRYFARREDPGETVNLALDPAWRDRCERMQGQLVLLASAVRGGEAGPLTIPFKPEAARF